MPLDYTYRIKVPHRTGQLARVAGTISDADGLIGDVTTINVGRETSIREITLEVEDRDQAERIVGMLNELEGVEVVWARDRALLKHEGGKLVIESAHPVRTVQDMRDVYTPGVARACQAIVEEPSLARELTMIGRSVAICTNGTRVLGLGDIGPVASMPVMEGKAVFYQQLAGISAMPILIDTKDVDEFIETVVRISPTFGGIHLEDISAPECFEIEARLIEALPQPVMHDDVHGTAVVTLAAALVACREAGLTLEEEVVGQIGLGAAGYGIAALMVDAGARRVLGSDPNTLSHERASAKGIEITEMQTVMAEADVVVATTGVPGLIEARDGARGAGDPGPHQPLPRDRVRRRPGSRRCLRRRRPEREQCPWLPRHLPRRPALGGPADQRPDEAGRRRGPGLPGHRLRAGPRRPRPQRAPAGSRRRARGGHRERGRPPRSGADGVVGDRTANAVLASFGQAFECDKVLNDNVALLELDRPDLL